MKNLKNPAFAFVVFIAIITIVYIYKNLHVFDGFYLLLLSISAAVNIFALSIYSLQDSAWKYKIQWVHIALIMIVASTIKAFLERVTPGKEIDNFIFNLWRFDDSWAPIMKLVWHLSTDLFVLFVVIIIKKVTLPNHQKTL